MPGPDAESLRGIATASLSQGLPLAAAEALQRALALAPDDSATLGMLGMVQIQLGRTAEAEATLARAVAVNPRDISSRFNLAYLRRVLGKTAAAAAEFEVVASLDPGHLGAWMNLADLFLEDGQAVAARIAYARAAALAPQIPEPHLGIARAANALEAFAEAEAACRASLETGQGLPHAWLELGRACIGQGRMRDAETALGNALRFSGGNVELEAVARGLLASLTAPDGAR